MDKEKINNLAYAIGYIVATVVVLGMAIAVIKTMIEFVLWLF